MCTHAVADEWEGYSITVPGEERDHGDGNNNFYRCIDSGVRASKQTNWTNERTLIFGLYATSHPVACATAPGSHPALPLPEKPEGARLLKTDTYQQQMHLFFDHIPYWIEKITVVVLQTNTKKNKKQNHPPNHLEVGHEFPTVTTFTIALILTFRKAHTHTPYAMLWSTQNYIHLVGALSKSNLERIITPNWWYFLYCCCYCLLLIYVDGSISRFAVRHAWTKPINVLNAQCLLGARKQSVYCFMVGLHARRTVYYW